MLWFNLFSHMTIRSARLHRLTTLAPQIQPYKQKTVGTSLQKVCWVLADFPKTSCFATISSFNPWSCFLTLRDSLPTTLLHQVFLTLTMTCFYPSSSLTQLLSQSHQCSTDSSDHRVLVGMLKSQIGVGWGVGWWSAFMKKSRRQAALPIFLQIRKSDVVLASLVSALQRKVAKVFGVPSGHGAPCRPPAMRQDTVSQ